VSDLSPLALVGIVSVAVLVVAWLVVSFAAPGRTQSRVAWIAATAMYVALWCLFASLTRDAWREDRTLPLFAFGFLLVVFTGGLGISLFRTAQAFRGEGKNAGSHATH
jgi:hypothetical protein